MDSAAPDETQGPRELDREGKRARIPSCNSPRWIRAETEEFVPVPKRGSGFWGRVQGDAFLVHGGGKDSFRFYEGIVSFVPLGETVSFSSACLFHDMRREKKGEKESAYTSANCNDSATISSSDERVFTIA